MWSQGKFLFCYFCLFCLKKGAVGPTLLTDGNDPIEREKLMMPERKGSAAGVRSLRRCKWRSPASQGGVCSSDGPRWAREGGRSTSSPREA